MDVGKSCPNEGFNWGFLWQSRQTPIVAGAVPELNFGGAKLFMT